MLIVSILARKLVSTCMYTSLTMPENPLKLPTAPICSESYRDALPDATYSSPTKRRQMLKAIVKPSERSAAAHHFPRARRNDLWGPLATACPACGKTAKQISYSLLPRYIFWRWKALTSISL